jgi:hypothetical protein
MKKPPVIAPAPESLLPEAIHPGPSFYRTPDLYISTVLVLSGFSLRNVEKSDNRAMYCFVPSDDINATISKYYSGELRLDPRQVFEVWKGLRSMAYRTVEDPR